MLKISYFQGFPPHLFDITDPWVASDTAWVMQWQSLSSPLLAYRQGSGEVRLIETAQEPTPLQTRR